MGAGQGIGGILQGLAQGFLEAKEEDKIKKTQEKETAKLQKRETIKNLLKEPGLHPAAKAAGFAFLTGGPGASKAEKELNEMMLTGTIKGTAQAVTTPGGSPTGGPQARINTEGKLEAGSAANVAIGEGGRGTPIGLQLPPETSFAPLDPITTLGPEENLFRTREDEADTARELRGELSAESREDEALLEQERIARRGSNITNAIDALGLDEDDPMRLRLIETVGMYKIGQEDATARLLTLEANPGLGLTEIGLVLDGFDLKTTTNSEAIRLIESTNPDAFASLGKNAAGTLNPMIKLRRSEQRLDREGKEADIAHTKRKDLVDRMTARFTALMQAGMGDMDVEAANTHLRGMSKLLLDYQGKIANLTLKQQVVDGITGDPISVGAFDAIQVDKDTLQFQADNTQFQIDRWQRKVDEVLGDQRDDEFQELEDFEVNVPVSDGAKPDPVMAQMMYWATIPNDSPKKLQWLVKTFSELTEGAEFVKLADLKFSDNPMLRISDQTMKSIRAGTARLRLPPGRNILNPSN